MSAAVAVRLMRKLTLIVRHQTMLMDLSEHVGQIGHAHFLLAGKTDLPEEGRV